MAENETGQAIDLRQYGRIVLKRIWVLATVFAVVVVATVIGTRPPDADLPRDLDGPD